MHIALVGKSNQSDQAWYSRWASRVCKVTKPRSLKLLPGRYRPSSGLSGRLSTLYFAPRYRKRAYHYFGRKL